MACMQLFSKKFFNFLKSLTSFFIYFNRFWLVYLPIDVPINVLIANKLCIDKKLHHFFWMFRAFCIKISQLWLIYLPINSFLNALSDWYDWYQFCKTIKTVFIKLNHLSTRELFKALIAKKTEKFNRLCRSYLPFRR